MKQKIFAVFDDKAKAFQLPFCMPEVGMAVRAFADACNDPGAMPGKHPEDFVLFRIGDFDTDDGSVTGKVEVIGRGIVYVKKVYVKKESE